MHPYDQGRKEFFQGKRNPYRRGTKDALQWALGFNEARKGFTELCAEKKNSY